MRNVERRWKVELAGQTTDVRVYDFATAFGEWDPVPVIGPDGEGGITFLARAIYPDGFGLWGCAVCEQWHPLGVSSCSLVGHPTESVAIGPIYHDGDQVTYVRATVAAGSFEHGRMQRGVGVFRLEGSIR